MATADVIRPDHAAQRKHFIFTDEHEQLRETIRRFATKELAPHADHIVADIGALPALLSIDTRLF